jgi:hypothetical protein
MLLLRLLSLKGSKRFFTFSWDAARFFFCVASFLVFIWVFLPVRRFGCALGVLAFPCFLIGLLASPLCGAALTFFAAAKKVSKESGLQPLAHSEPSQ